MKKTIFFALVLVIGLTTEVANADFTFGEPVNLKSVIPVIDPVDESIDCLSSDGLEIYIESSRPGGYGALDIWVLRRDSINADWAPPENLGPLVNSPSSDNVCSISTDGLTLYFSSNRPGGNGKRDIYVTKRATRNEPWEEAVNIGPVINSSVNDGVPWISPDNLEIYFSSRRPGGYGDSDIYVTRRATQNDPWGEPVNLGPEVNTPYEENNISLSPDGLLLLFDDSFSESGPRPGGYGDGDIWMARRLSLTDSWQAALNLGPKVNSSIHDLAPRISPEGSMLYFSTVSGTWENWQAPIIPIVDLNGDGIVDGADLSIIADHWGTDDSLCDIGPMPWGDGVVDVQDLIVIAEYLSPAGPEEVNVNENDDGGQIELEQGQILVVTLESNPTTGYQWEQAENQELYLEQMGQPDFKQSLTDGPPIVGAGGWEIFRFKAISAGKMTLQLVYRRSWEEGVEPVNTFSLDVVIR